MAILALALTFIVSSCTTTDIEQPPPPDYSSSADDTGSSSSSDAAVPSSSSFLALPSSSSVAPSSSSLPAYAYCVFLEERICLLGPMTACPAGGTLSNSCPYSSSSSVVPSSSSIDLPSSSSVLPPSSSSPISGTSGTFTDARDGKVYRWVKIGEQYWMAENLNYVPTTGTSACYNNLPANCETYGRLYDWSTAVALPSSCNSSTCASQVGTKHIGICPGGWHLPSDADWNALMKTVNPSCSDNASCASAGTKLKANTTLWNSYNNIPTGTDNYGFAALPGGLGYSGGSFDFVGLSGYWWSASEGSSNYAYDRGIYYDYESASWYDNSKSFLFSVRCVQD